jgi:hypothetical protein
MDAQGLGQTVRQQDTARRGEQKERTEDTDSSLLRQQDTAKRTIRKDRHTQTAAYLERVSRIADEHQLQTRFEAHLMFVSLNRQDEGCTE